MASRGAQEARNVETRDLDESGRCSSSVLRPDAVCDWFELAGEIGQVDDASGQAIAGQTGVVVQVVSVPNQVSDGPLGVVDFARYLVAEVACNPWSAGARVECIGVGYGLAALNPDRVRVREGPTDGGDDPVDDALAEAVRTLDNSTAVGVDVVTARATQAGAEAWTVRLILLDASTAHPALDELLNLVHAHPRRTGTCVVLNGPRPDAPGIVLDVTADGRSSSVRS